MSLLDPAHDGDAGTAGIRNARRSRQPVNAINNLAYSLDGRQLALAYQDGTVKVWNTGARTCEHRFYGHGAGVNGVAFSPDGRRLATASLDRTLVIWDLGSERSLFTLRGHEEGVTGVAFSPDGQVLASTSWDQTLRLWNPATGEPLRVVRGHRGGMLRLAFHPQGQTLATAGEDGTIKLWEPATGRDLRTLYGHLDAVTGVAFDADGRCLVSGSWDRTVRVWDSRQGVELHRFPGHAGVVFDVALSRDGRRAASASWDRTVKVWDTQTAQEVFTFAEHLDIVYAVAFDPSGLRLASGGRDRQVRVWAPAGPQARQLLRRRFSAPRSEPRTRTEGVRPVAPPKPERLVRPWEWAEGETPADETASPVMENHLVFTVAGRVFALPSPAVLEVTRPGHIEPKAEGPKWLRGTTRLRDGFHPVMDLQAFLGMPPVESTAGNHLLLVKPPSEDRPRLLLVERVQAVQPVAVGQLASAEAIREAPEATYVRGVARHQGAPLLLLDPDRLLTAMQLQDADRVL
jgi:chemotaxis signal transduction protein